MFFYSHKRLWLLMAVLAGGCATGHTDLPATVAVPAQWKAVVVQPAGTQTLPPTTESADAWWNLFNDPVLDDLARKAVAANQEIRQAVARMEQARAITRAQVANRRPDVAFNSAYDIFKRSGSVGGANLHGDLLGASFDLDYEVDLWGRVRHAIESARADEAATRIAQDAVRLTVTAEVARHYFALRQMDTEDDLLRRAIDLRRAMLQIAQDRAEAGVVSQLDVARAQTELATAETERLEVQRRRAEMENLLALLCGQNASDFTLAATPFSTALSPPAVPSGLPSTLLERRPDVVEANLRLASANARIGVAEAAFFPTVRLTGSAGLSSDELDRLFDRKNQTRSLGVSLSLPLLAGERNDANRKAAQSEWEEASTRYRQRVLGAFAEVEIALANLQWLGQQSAAQTRVVEAAQSAASLSESRYQNGLVSYLEVADAERQRLQAERGATQLLGARLTATVLLVKALGGAW
jgi:multidrug efflux system outer membrane protein